MFSQLYGQELDKDLLDGAKSKSSESMFKNVTLPAHVQPQSNNELGPDFVRAVMNNHSTPSVQALNALFGKDGQKDGNSGAGSGGGEVGGAGGERLPAGYMAHVEKVAREINAPEEDVNTLRQRAAAAVYASSNE